MLTPATGLVPLAIVSLVACAGDVTHLPSSLGAPPLQSGDAGTIGADAEPPQPTPAEPEADLGTSQPQPDTLAPLPGPGEVCPAAECTADAICLGGVCHRKCTTQAQCNEKQQPGCAADEICLPASSFTDACIPAIAKLGELCGPDADGALCQAGMLCINVNEAKARCMKLCEYGCAPGQQCAGASNGCDVCVIQ